VLFAVGGDRLARAELADQPRIKPVARDELGVGAGLDQAAAIERLTRSRGIGARNCSAARATALDLDRGRGC
jgi:hypothetical protein